MSKKRLIRISFVSFATLILSIGLLMTHFVNVKADFIANNLMDDGIFENYNSMGPAQIDAFLNNNFPSSCISTNNGFTAPQPIGYSPSTGFTYGGNVSAGQVIGAAAQAYHINPQVLLATLEKESSVVTGSASYHCQYINTAMGYDCPDSGSCPQNPATESGFSQQIIHAAWLLKFDEQHSKGIYNWAEIHDNWNNSDDLNQCYYGPMTQGYFQRGAPSGCNQVTYFDGFNTIDGSSVHMDTAPTAALYHYTPHFHGNQLFVSTFESWFGTTHGVGEVYNLVTSQLANGDTRQWVVYHGMRHVIPDTNTKVAWGLQNKPLLQWDDKYLGSFQEGAPLGRLMRPTGTLDVYFVDNGYCYRIVNPSMLAAWNFNPSAILDVSVYLGQVPTNAGNLTYAIRNSADAINVYVVDGGVARRYSAPDILSAWEGDGATITTISSTYFNMMGSSSDINTTRITDGTTEYQVVSSQKLAEPSTAMSSLYPAGTPLTVSSATLNRLVRSAPVSQFIRAYNSNTIYLVDGGMKHAIGEPEQVRAWGVGASPLVNIVTQGNINLIPTGGPLNSFEADVSGQLYLMDGRKITIPSSLDSNYRTIGNIYSPSNSLMSLLPAGEQASQYIKGFNTPTVYQVNSATLNNIGTVSNVPNGQQITSVSEYVLNQFGPH